MTQRTYCYKRRLVLTSTLGLAALSQAPFAKTAPVIRIGVLKATVVLRLMQDRGTLENAGVRVQWLAFDAGPSLMQGMADNLIDFGIVGEGPSIVSQADGLDFVYVGYETSNPELIGLLVQKFSRINRIEDLKGKKIAVLKSSNAHWLILSLLKKAGLKYSDVELAYMLPDQAFTEFKRGSVDAWAIWEPNLSYAKSILGARQVDVSNVKNYYLLVARRAFFLKEKALIHQLIDLLNIDGQWMKQYPQEAAAKMMRYISLPKEVIEKQIALTVPIYKGMDAKAINNQQEIADAFWEAKLIAKKIQIKDAL